MGFLRAPSSTTQVTEYSGLQVQSTSGAVPVPIVYGRNLLAPNCIWYENFESHPQSSGKGGGKGGGGGGQTTSWTYTCDIIMGVCEGPVTEINDVWQTSPTPTNLSALGLSFFNGAQGQAVWSYLASAYPSQALSYSGTCYVAATKFNLGSNATVNSNNFEVYGFFQGTGANGEDADPAQVLYDFLTNSQYGVGIPASSINSASIFGNNSGSYQAYCFANGLCFSPVLNSTESAAAIISRWLQLTNSTAVWSGGLLKIIPYGDSNITANGWTFTANTTALYSLTDEDFVYSTNQDPVATTITDPYSAYNWQDIEIQSRDDSYNTGPVTVWDQGAIEQFGLRVGSTVSAHEICDLAVAQTSVQLILQRQVYVRRHFTFKLSTVLCLLEPMDLVNITDPSIGPSPITVRITEIDEDDAGDLTVTAEEFPIGVASSAAYPTQAVSNGAPNTTVVPNAINAPVIIEPPPSLTGNAVQLWMGVSPQNGDPNWGGCIVYASLDNTSYAEVATINAKAAQGVTSAPLPAYGGSNPDTADTLGVDLTRSLGTLTSTTPAAAAQGVTLCYVGGEYISFTTATLTAANEYNLTGLYRGQVGVASQAISSGSPFCFLDSAILKYTVPNAEIGDLIYLKFASFNIYNQSLQSLASCAAYTYVVSGTGVLGPVASSLAVGTAMDYGHTVGDSISESDDWGTATSSVTSVIDLGNCTS